LLALALMIGTSRVFSGVLEVGKHLINKNLLVQQLRDRKGLTHVVALAWSCPFCYPSCAHQCFKRHMHDVAVLSALIISMFRPFVLKLKHGTITILVLLMKRFFQMGLLKHKVQPNSVLCMKRILFLRMGLLKHRYN
jgi:hypothetical protein